MRGTGEIGALFLCITSLITITESKLIKGVAVLDSQVTELYVAKFAFSSGQIGSISVRVESLF